MPSTLTDRRYSCLLVGLAIHVVSWTRFAGCMRPLFPDMVLSSRRLLPSLGSQRAWFPALAGTMKALRLPTCASAVAYLVRFRRPRDPSYVCVRHCARGAVALLEILLPGELSGNARSQVQEFPTCKFHCPSHRAPVAHPAGCGP
jgi:hypothetical protein